MPEDYLDNEILQFAIVREQDAYMFFTAMAGRMAEEGMRRFFLTLAEEELEHKARLELEIMKQGRVVTKGEGSARLKKDYPIIIGVDRGLEMTYKDALLLGRDKENVSFRFYADLAANTNEPQARDMLFALAEEELKHKIRFEQEYDSVCEWEERGV